MLFPEKRHLEVRIKIKMVIHIQYLDERNPVVFSFYVDRLISREGSESVFLAITRQCNCHDNKKNLQLCL